MSALYIIHPNVQLGQKYEIGEFAILGVAPRGCTHGELKTVIGPGAVIRSHTVIYAGNRIGSNFQTGHGVLLRELNEIGHDVSIGSHSIIEHHVKVGSGVRIHSNAFIPEFSIIEDGAWIGPSVVVTNAMYPQSPGTKSSLRGAHIMPGAKIGANATLLPGIVIGRDALVGAGAVVVRDVPGGKVVVGNPGRIIKDISELSAYDVEKFAKGE